MPPKRVDDLPEAMRTFTIEGKIKPYVRMTQRSKYCDPQAIEYLASQEEVGWVLRMQMSTNGWDLLPLGGPISVSVVFTFPGAWHNADLDNQIKAVLDAAKGIVWHDDRWIDSLYGARKAGDDYCCVMKVCEI